MLCLVIRLNSYTVQLINSLALLKIHHKLQCFYEYFISDKITINTIIIVEFMTRPAAAAAAAAASLRTALLLLL